MSLFKKNNKKKLGKESRISFTASPYLKKGPASEHKFSRTAKRKLNLATPKPSNNYIKKGKRILALILGIGIVLFTIYALFFSDYFLVTDFEVEEEGTLIESNDKINEILRHKLGENLFLINEKDLAEEIKKEHREIQTIKIKKIFPGKIRVEYEKYPTTANIINITEGIQKKFLVDSQGLLIEENTENPNLPYIRIETPEQLTIRTTFLEDPKRAEQRLTYMINAINLFEEKFGMQVLHAEFLKKEREVHLYTEKLFYILIDMEKDLNTQINKLKKALSKLDIYNEPLLYIDLRISGTDTEKVIFKRK
jgi:cell division septal protein FtsQ